MRFNTLDQIVRNVLLSKRLSLHFYVEFLTHAANCLRELTIDTLQVINTIELIPNSYYAIDLPCDFVDDLSLGIPVGQYVKPIAKRDNINRLANTNTLGQKIPYGNPAITDGTTGFFGFWPGWTWYWNIDDFGESTGRLYGAGTISRNGYELIRERNQIQLTETFIGCKVVLQYISDGQCIDNATQITPMAFSCISAYINWKRGPNADIDRSPEGIAWVNARKVLRARMDDLDIPSLKQILHSNYRGSPKN